LKKKDPYFPEIWPTIGYVDLSLPPHCRKYLRQNLLKQKVENSEIHAGSLILLLQDPGGN